MERDFVIAGCNDRDKKYVITNCDDLNEVSWRKIPAVRFYRIWRKIACKSLKKP